MNSDPISRASWPKRKTFMQLVRGFLLLFLPPAAKGCNARIHPYHYAYIVSATDLSGAKAPAVFCFLFFFLAPAVYPSVFMHHPWKCQLQWKEQIMPCIVMKMVLISWNDLRGPGDNIMRTSGPGAQGGITLPWITWERNRYLTQTRIPLERKKE